MTVERIGHGDGMRDLPDRSDELGIIQSVIIERLFDVVKKGMFFDDFTARCLA